MKRLVYITFSIIFSLNSLSQTKIEKLKEEVFAEGKKLYESEMASWYGTDIFLENYKNRESIGGYLSYSGDSLSKCIFFSKGSSPKVIGTISFDKTYNVKNAIIDLKERELSKEELDLYTIRNKALSAINSDTIFKQYENTNLNLIPLIFNGEKKVYVITGPTKNGVVIFGNDYLLSFDK